MDSCCRDLTPHRSWSFGAVTIGMCFSVIMLSMIVIVLVLPFFRQVWQVPSANNVSEIYFSCPGLCVLSEERRRERSDDWFSRTFSFSSIVNYPVVCNVLLHISNIYFLLFYFKNERKMKKLKIFKVISRHHIDDRRSLDLMMKNSSW